MEDSTLRERLIEAARLVEASSNFQLRVTSDGIRVYYMWEDKRYRGKFNSKQKIVSWQEIERTGTNPLLLAITTLSKQAAACQ